MAPTRGACSASPDRSPSRSRSRDESPSILVKSVMCFKIHVLGHFRLLKLDAPIQVARRLRKPQELLQALIALGGTEVCAGALIDALWPDSEGDAAYHALESTLYRLRQLLGAPDAVRMAGSKVSLDRDRFWVDMWEFEQELQRPRDDMTNPAERIGRIQQLYKGHFLEHGSEKPWALKTRYALRDRFLRVIRDAARMCESRRLWQDAANLYQSALELDSLNEDLYRGLMVCHQELGDHSEALQAYWRCRELLTRFLGVPPNAKTDALYHSVRERASAAAAIHDCSHPNVHKTGAVTA
jgi:LuxR family maltose regulon positive regulatory protein